MRSLDFVLPWVAVAAFGCSAPVVASAEADAETSSAATAVVLVERTASAGENARAEAVARFVRVRGAAVDQSALRLVGAAIDFPPMGTCSSQAAVRASAPESGVTRAVELMNLGAITVEANGSRLSLQPRRLPDIVDLVSGVVYSTRAPAPEALPAETAYVLRASGRPDLDLSAFAVTAIAPSEPYDLLVAGQDARSVGGVVVRSDGPTEVTWGAGAADDLVYVDVTEAPSTGAKSFRCLFDDAGRAVLPAALFGGGEGTLAVHRLHRESFLARGIDAGEVRFDFARVVAFRR